MSESLKAQLPRTWAAFWARHGNFTEAQRRAIPLILAGESVLVVAATASGKTEAAIAPLLERHVLGQPRPEGLTLLYLCPTRALVRDLYERLAPPLAALGVSLAMKSGDTGPVSATRPPSVLLTTPESTDALLGRAPRVFATLRALVLDEIHLFDGGPRGDQLRCLLRRIERIRDFAQPGTPPTQRVALSATLADPAAVAARYLTDAPPSPAVNAVNAVNPKPEIQNPKLVTVSGGRALVADLMWMEGLASLAQALGLRAARKALVFCNTRNEVEQVAAFLRQNLPYEATLLVHYSNLDPALRREVEARFAEATVALCVSSSTLELGIDIGTIDDIALVGPPPTLASFGQRVGRGGRRASETRVLCLARSELELLRFNALLDGSDPAANPQSEIQNPKYSFLPSVLVQQSFSLLKQSPTGSLRLADLRRLAPDEVPDEALRAILGHLAATGYLKPGRPGEWRPGPALDPLIDAHEIYSNIGGETLNATVVDAYSGRRLAQAERPRRKGETLQLGGQAQQVAWRDRWTFAVQRGRREEADEKLRFRTAPFAVPPDVTQAMAAHLGVLSGELPHLVDESGSWLFHFWGDLYGEWLAALLQAHFPAGDEEPRIDPWNEVCLWLPFPLDTLPSWDSALAEQEARRLARRVEPYLELGRFHSFLPSDVAMRTIVARMDLPRFEALYRAATLVAPSAGLRDTLRTLL